MLRFLCITPIPPFSAIEMAIVDSVTVSIAEDRKGNFNFKELERLVVKFVWDGIIEEYRGNNNTSSNVKASLIGPIYTYIQFYKFIKLLFLYNVYKFLLKNLC